MAAPNYGSVNNTDPPAHAEVAVLDKLYNTPFRGFICGVAGNVSVQMAGDDADVVWPAMVAGVLHPCLGKSINTSGTTATGVLLVW